jgi:hypothetical protein
MNNHERSAPTSDAPVIPNSYFENLLRLKTEQPTVFRLLSPVLRASAEYYRMARDQQAANACKGSQTG